MLTGIAGLSERFRDSMSTAMRPTRDESESSFTELLDGSLRAHAARMGYDLPIAPADPAAAGGLERADEIWDRVQAQSQAGPGGIADALMRSLSEAADRRWEQRRDREHGTSSMSRLFDL